MTMAVSKAVEHGAKAVICASTGNTSASAAAYAAHAGITAAVLVPEGKIAMGKLSQAVAHNAQLIQVQGNFDDCLEIARELADNYPVHLVNSVNTDRIEGQKTAAFEVVEVLGDAPDFHFIPVGNAGNYTAYSRGYREELGSASPRELPRMFGFQAAGQRADRARRRRQGPRHDRQRDPHRQPRLVGARPRRARGQRRLLRRDRRRHDPRGAALLSAEVGIFVEPASAISVAGLLERAEAGAIPRARPSCSPSPATASRTRSGRCAPPTARDVKPTVVAGRRRMRSPACSASPHDREARRSGAGRAHRRRCGCPRRARTSGRASTRSASRSRLRRARGRRATEAGSRSRSRRRRGRGADRRVEPRRPVDRLRVRRRRASRCPGCGSRPTTSSRTAAASARPVPRSSSGIMAAKGLLEGIVEIDARDAAAARDRARGPPRQRRARAVRRPDDRVDHARAGPQHKKLIVHRGVSPLVFVPRGHDVDRARAQPAARVRCRTRTRSSTCRARPC